MDEDETLYPAELGDTGAPPLEDDPAWWLVCVWAWEQEW
jgi:hypothetical protein